MIREQNQRKNKIRSNLLLTDSSLGKDINWSSTQEATIDPYTGVVSRNSSDVNITLTATINAASKDFNLTVLATPATSADKLAKDKVWLNFARILDKNRDNNNVIYNLIKPLPESAPNDSTITWTTSNSEVITVDGDVFRDSLQDKYIKLIATFTNGGTVTKEFILKVLKNVAATTATPTEFKRVDNNATSVSVVFDRGSDSNISTSASFNATIASKVEQVISEDSVKSVIELTDRKVNLYLNTDGTAESQSEFLDDNNNSVVSSIKVDVPKSISTVDENGTVDTTVSFDVNTTLTAELKSDGSVSHSVQSSDTNKTTSAASTIKGSKVEVDTSGNVETSSEVVKGGYIYKAVARSNSNGQTITKFIRINISTGNEDEVSNTMKDSTPYEAGNQVSIDDINGTIYISTQAPLNGNLEVE